MGSLDTRLHELEARVADLEGYIDTLVRAQAMADSPAQAAQPAPPCTCPDGSGECEFGDLVDGKWMCNYAELNAPPQQPRDCTTCRWDYTQWLPDVMSRPLGHCGPCDHKFSHWQPRGGGGAL